MHLSSQEEYGLRCLIQVARAPGPAPLTIHQIAEAEGLSPLERIRVIGRVRTGSATLTGSPILELLSLSILPR